MLSISPTQYSVPNRQTELTYIPKQVFQSHEKNNVDVSLFQASQTWSTLNPEWNYHFFNDQMRHQFIQDNFPDSVLKAYEQLIPGAFKADLWRYCILYVHGGVYADPNKVLLTGLNELLDKNTEFTATLDKEKMGKQNLIYNAFIAAKPKHPFLKRAIDKIVQNVKQGNYGKTALHATGPGLLGEAINEVLGREIDAEFTVGKQTINGYNLTLWYFDSNPTKEISSKYHTIYKDKSLTTLCFATRYVGSNDFIMPKEGQFSVEKILLAKYALAWVSRRIYKHGIVLESDKNPVLSDKQILKVEYQRAIKTCYKQKKFSFARELARQAFRLRIFSFKLFSIIFKAELRNAFK